MKKKSLFVLIFLTLFASFVTFYAVNLLMSDLANYATSTYLISSFPMAFLSASLILMVLYIVRINKYPSNKKYFTKKYLIALLVLSVLGLITSILTGTICYGSFGAPYPFAGYSIIMLVMFALMILALVFGLVVCIPKMKEDKESFKKPKHHVIYGIFLGIALAYSFNKFGAFLWLPVYAQWRLFDLTFIYFLSLITPMFYLMIVVFKELKMIKEKSIKVLLVVLLSLVIVSHIYTIIVGSISTEFLSAISPTVPIDRLGSKPFDILIRTFAMIAASTVLFVKSFKK